MSDLPQPDLEDVIDGCLTVFKAQFAANLTAVDSRKTTPLTPQAPIEWIFGDRDMTPQLPCVVITGHQTQENEDEYQWRKQTFQLMIEAYYPADDVEKCSRIMRRYGSAIDDTLRQNQSLNGTVKNVANIQQAYWDTMKGNTGLFQLVRVTFDAQLYTD